jgi:uncharacterized protein YbaR (Trm112 family)
MLRQLQSKVGVVWCRFTHESLMWPVHGHYACRTCGRVYPVFPDIPVAESKETRSMAAPLLAGKLSRTAWLSRA